MDTLSFNKIVDFRVNSIYDVLAKKAKEYATEDRLHNFKTAARIKNETPEQALWGMATKHLVSVIDMLEGNTLPTEALINEKLGDMINYLILLEAILKEKINA